MEEKKKCQCYGTPLSEETFAHELDGSVNEEYCKWCYHDGVFTYRSMNELIDACIHL